jgi:hypothetical protein
LLQPASIATLSIRAEMVIVVFMGCSLKLNVVV